MNEEGPASDRHATGPENQSSVIRILSNREAYGGSTVQRIDTHAAIVFLAGKRAYKLKRAVRYPYLDYSTVERRKAMCLQELRINRRTAPGIYLGIAPILEGDSGVLRLGPVSDQGAKEGDHTDAAVLDWVVVMHRFDQSDLLSAMADDDRLDPMMIDRLADEITRFHKAADRTTVPHHAAVTAKTALESLDEMAAAPEIFDAERVLTLRQRTQAWLDDRSDRLDERGASGFVRACHGDLHLRNVVMWKDSPTLFDAIEFDSAFSTIDVLYDLAFLLMDLDQRGYPDLANRAMNRYLARTDEYHGLSTLPLYLSMRAAVRAKVGASLAGLAEGQAERSDAVSRARKHMEDAERYLKSSTPHLIAVGGVSGTGKSTLAAELAPVLAGAPGAVVLRTDVIRKVLAGVEPETALPPEAYSGGRRGAVYEALVARARITLSEGRSVIVDAVLGEPRARHGLEQLAKETRARFDGLWLTGAQHVLEERIDARTGDASDADAGVLRRQIEHLPSDLVDSGPQEDSWTTLVVDSAVRVMGERALRALSRRA